MVFNFNFFNIFYHFQNLILLANLFICSFDSSTRLVINLIVLIVKVNDLIALHQFKLIELFFWILIPFFVLYKILYFGINLRNI